MYAAVAAAAVTAIDINQDMLAMAGAKFAAGAGSADLREMAAVEIADRRPAARTHRGRGTARRVDGIARSAGAVSAALRRAAGQRCPDATATRI